MNSDGTWICLPCGNRYGRNPSVTHISSWHIGHCDYCGAKDLPVTEPRDFGYPTPPEVPNEG